MRKKKKVTLTFLYTVVFACIAVIGYSGYMLYNINAEYSKSDNLYAEIRKQAVVQYGTRADISVENHQTNAPDASNEKNGNNINGGQMASGDIVQDGGTQSSTQSGAVQNVDANTGEAYQPVVDGANMSRINFDVLYDINSDTVAWITIDGTEIDYPVVQGGDNEYYLTRLFTREYGSAGSIFMDYTNAPDFSDRNTVIFGHHMKNGSMFAGLDAYKKQQHYDEHPDMALFTPQGDYYIQWFAGYVVPPDPLPISFSSDEVFMEYVQKAMEKSDFTSNVQVQPDDRIITLCTCTYVYDNARYILIGVIR